MSVCYRRRCRAVYVVASRAGPIWTWRPRGCNFVLQILYQRRNSERSGTAKSRREATQGKYQEHESCYHEIGLRLPGFGVLFSFPGIIMLFDKGFLAMGNNLFVSGVLLIIGLNSTVQFFTKPKNHKGSIAFGIGLFLVLIGWPVLGMMVESYGIVALFSGFWPTAAVYLQKTPAVGWIFQHPFVTSVFQHPFVTSLLT